MNASGFLLPPFAERTREQALLWDATFERIQPFLPELRGEPLCILYSSIVGRPLMLSTGELFPAPQVPVPFSPNADAATDEAPQEDHVQTA